MGRSNAVASRCWMLALCLVATPVLYAGVRGSLNHPTGTRGIIMVDKIGGYLRFFDPTMDRELASFTASDEDGFRPHELAISPDHTRAYVTVYGDGVFGRNPHPGHSIDVLDLVHRRMLGSIELSPYRAPHGIQVGADGKLYVACDLDHVVLIIDPIRRRVEAAIDVAAPGHWLALAPGARKLYVSSHHSQPFISVLDLSSRRMVGRIPVATGTMGVAVSPDGQTLLAADASEPFLHVISTATDLEIGRVPVLGAVGGLYKVFYSPDGRRVLTCMATGQVNILDATDLHAPQQVVMSAGTALMGIAFSPDGRSALVGNHGQGTVSRIDLDKASLVNTFPAGKGVETLAYY